ncbi:hypothetical protein DL98DRAFT_92899 [Cadophora sp. DSE1049]|nr:hypothetical protein DL98DRAFT_92899 [Cadophora sp. DSE1049]
MATRQSPVGESPAEASSHHSVDAGSDASSSGSEKQEIPQPCYATYKQYLDENAADWPELKWMQIFMNTPSGDPDDTRVTIIDSTDGPFHRQMVPVTEPNNLWNIVQNRGPDVTTRVIFVDYRDSFCIDRTMVDILGETFDIDPLVFQEHFHHEALSADDGYSSEVDYAIPEHRVAHLPSQYRTGVGFNLHFSLHNFTSACAIILGGNFDKTGLVDSTSTYV